MRLFSNAHPSTAYKNFLSDVKSDFGNSLLVTTHYIGGYGWEETCHFQGNTTRTGPLATAMFPDLDNSDHELPRTGACWALGFDD